MSVREFSPEELSLPGPRLPLLTDEEQLSPEALLYRVAQEFGLRVDAIRSHGDRCGATKTVMRARRRVWEALRARGWSYPEIAAVTGHEHSSVYQTLNRPPGRQAR